MGHVLAYVSLKAPRGARKAPESDSSMLHVLALVLLAQAGAPSQGNPSVVDVPRSVYQNSNAITAAPLNVAITTDALSTTGYRYFMFEFTYVYSAATAVTMTCQYSNDATTWYNQQLLAYVSGGTFSSAARVWSYTTGAANANWAWTVPCRAQYLRCTFTGTSGAVGDLLTVRARSGR